MENVHKTFHFRTRFQLNFTIFQFPAAFIFLLIFPLLRITNARFCFYVIEVHIFSTWTICPGVFARYATSMAADAFI
ncbi:hypothetical protein BMB171_C1904 [Bacillus thuringiensis BMB171]|nr:hypothetical protein BMB171_C1904 [Bacillus thuringiensis BMB171]